MLCMNWELSPSLSVVWDKLFDVQETIPFAVVGSNAIVEVNNKKVRGRMYPWGVVEVENMEHCDFVTLRNMLIRWGKEGRRERGRGWDGMGWVRKGEEEEGRMNAGRGLGWGGQGKKEERGWSGRREGGEGEGKREREGGFVRVCWNVVFYYNF